MSSQGASRKRPAPGASPLVTQPAPAPSLPPLSVAPDVQLSNDQFLQWGQNVASNPGNAVDPHAAPAPVPAQAPGPGPGTGPVPAPYPPVGSHADIQNLQPHSNQLARRQGSNQLVSRRAPPDQDVIPLVDQSGMRSNEPADGVAESEAELEQRAIIAKKDALVKRKQIPPFVQKLRSFLDESKNTDLIRWSDDGNSFIVLDEEEFAKKLIPELFKHNNYASFVRQLNMYGFHKKVGLSDNSMRASERKNKSPSEYANPYFRRGKPDLLWLIQKPKSMGGHGSKGSKSSARVKSEPEGDEGDADEPTVEEAPSRDDKPSKFRGQLTLPSGEEQQLPQEQLSNVYQELQNIRQQQQIISNTIGKLRREHEQLYGQAASFQEQHTRHENSINAILTFLATVYNRSLQGHEGAQGLVNNFSGTIPQDTGLGNIVDVGDYVEPFDPERSNNPSSQRTFKRQPLLLKAPPAVGPDGQPLNPPSGSQYDMQHQHQQAKGRRPPSSHSTGIQSGDVEELFDSNSPSSTTRNQPQPQQQHHPQHPQQEQVPPTTSDSQAGSRYPSQPDIMSLIQNSNARNNLQTTQSDFPAVLSSLENSAGNSPLSAAQRADMLRMIANESSASDPSGTTSNNALVSPNPPPMPQNYPGRLANTRAEIDNLVKMQAEQDRSVQNLTNLLQPLSPTGSIPGLDQQSKAGTAPTPPLDLDQIFNSDYFTDYPSDADKGGNNNNNNRANQSSQPNNNQSGAGKTDASGSSFGANSQQQQQTNDLFDFDSLHDRSFDDIFGNNSNVDTQPQPQRQRPATGYFDGYENMPGSHPNFDPSRIAGGSGTDNNANNNSGSGMGGPFDGGGRVTENYTSSGGTSPANTSVDENSMGVDTADSAPKRQRRSQ